VGKSGAISIPATQSFFRQQIRAFGLSWPVVGLFLVLAVVPVFVKEVYILRLLAISLLLGSQAMAFDFTGGFINAVNFGFAGFVGLGAYISGLLASNFGISPWLGLLCALIVSGLVGFFTGMLTLPLRGIYVSLMSWFVGMALMALASAMVNVTRGARGLIMVPLMENESIQAHFYVLLGLTLVTYLLFRGIIRTNAGLAFLAIGQNFDAARASGVNPTRYKLINFTLSCAWAGLLGGYYGHFVGIITPDIMDTGHTMEVMALSYIGGSGSLLGGLIAAFLFIPAFDYLKRLVELRLLIYGMSLILIMILYPSGLAGLYQVMITHLRRWRLPPANNSK
jgi:branched-chain amino acid transport system permease protein